MLRRLIQCALCFALSLQFCDSTPQQTDIAGKNTASGCFHNNTMFADTSIIPSSEPCLLCRCSNKNLVCVRRMCKDQPYPPPRGCILVYKKSSCCPYLSCSKYHINYYKNAEKHRDHMNQLSGTHEKVLEKNSRVDVDVGEEMNGGCIESGSLYASGSAMVRSSASLCNYCYCINGHSKCIKPKCLLVDTKCKPVFVDASCCPVKYDCSSNTTALESDKENLKQSTPKRKNRSNGCFESEKFYQEGEKLPSNEKRPCEMCYCIKGFRKCVIKKCAPMIRGCIPKLPREGSCCPTSYDCSRSLKVTRQIQQSDDDEPEEDTDTDSIDFFSLLFGSDEPPEEEKTEIASPVETSTVLPFKALPTTEKSFFDFIRAGLEIIDANADKIDSSINDVVTTPKISAKNEIFSVISDKPVESSTEKFTTTSMTTTTLQRKTTPIIESSHRPVTESTTTQFPAKTKTFLTEAITSPTKKLTPTTTRTKSSTPKVTPTTEKSKNVADSSIRTKVMPTTLSPSTKAKTTATTTRRTVQTTKLQTSTKLPPPSSTTARTTTMTSTTEKIRETTSKVLIETISSTSSKRPALMVEQHQHHHHPAESHFDGVIIHSDSKIIDSAENEAETLPNIEIIPFVAHDAIDTEKFEPYHKPYDNLEKDYFGSDKEKPFRYNNKFIHHGYDEPVFGYNPHERIDNGPYYFETDDNQFDSFSPPSEQDFLGEEEIVTGGFSPKESIYEEILPTIASELPLQSNQFQQKPLDAKPTLPTAAPEHKSNVTSTEKTLTLPINQTTTTTHKSVESHRHTTIPNFKKISTNFTSFIDELLSGNVLEETSTKVSTTSTTTIPTTSTSQTVKPVINDDDFIMKHLKAPATVAKQPQGMMEIFSKPTSPVMNGLLKLAGCNIYGQMYDVGNVIEELSNACLECKCLPDIGVGCTPKC